MANNVISGFTCIRSPSCQTQTKPEPDPKPGFGTFQTPNPDLAKRLRACNQYWWLCEINSSAAELILVAQLAALQIAELLLVNSDSFDSVRRTDDSNFGHQSSSSPN